MKNLLVKNSTKLVRRFLFQIVFSFTGTPLVTTLLIYLITEIFNIRDRNINFHLVFFAYLTLEVFLCYKLKIYQLFQFITLIVISTFIGLSVGYLFAVIFVPIHHVIMRNFNIQEVYNLLYLDFISEKEKLDDGFEGSTLFPINLREDWSMKGFLGKEIAVGIDKNKKLKVADSFMYDNQKYICIEGPKLRYVVKLLPEAFKMKIFSHNGDNLFNDISSIRHFIESNSSK